MFLPLLPESSFYFSLNFLTLKSFFKKKWPILGLFYCFFSLFKITSFLQEYNRKKCPSSIWCRDSNPRPLGRKSPPITTRPGRNFCESFYDFVLDKEVCSPSETIGLGGGILLLRYSRYDLC